MAQKSVVIADIVAYHPGEDAFPCARINAQDVDSIERIVNTHMADGADRVAISIRGIEYDCGVWIAYINGDLDRAEPWPTTRSQA